MKTLYIKSPIVYFLIPALTLVLATGCSKSPEHVVEQYLDLTFLGNNGKQAYKLISSDDKKYKTEQEFIKDIKKKNILSDNVLKNYEDQYFYEITETKDQGDTTLVKVNLTRPNAENILHEMVGFAMLTAITQQTEEEKNDAMESKFIELLKDQEMESVTEEKEYTVIKEKEQYKIYLNLGLPIKQEQLKAQLEKLNQEAEEELRLVNFKGATELYKKMQSLSFSEEVHAKILNLEKIQRNTITLGEKLVIGNLEITPVKIEVRKINYKITDWQAGSAKPETSPDNYFVLTYELKNRSDAEAFSHEEPNKYKKKYTIFDNFGNTMEEFEPNYNIENLEGNVCKKICPGEHRIVKAVCEAPLSKKASEFLWEVKLLTDNKKSTNSAYISFTKDQIDFSDGKAIAIK